MASPYLPKYLCTHAISLLDDHHRLCTAQHLYQFHLQYVLVFLYNNTKTTPPKETHKTICYVMCRRWTASLSPPSMWLASSRPDAKAIKGKYGQQISVLQGRQPTEKHRRAFGRCEQEYFPSLRGRHFRNNFMKIYNLLRRLGITVILVSQMMPLGGNGYVITQ